MNEVLLEHGGAASFGSYTSVSFSGSGWCGIFCSLHQSSNYTIGEAATYATARVAKLYTPETPWQPGRILVAICGLWRSQYSFCSARMVFPGASVDYDQYGGHFPDVPPNEPPTRQNDLVDVLKENPG